MSKGEPDKKSWTLIVAGGLIAVGAVAAYWSYTSEKKSNKATKAPRKKAAPASSAPTTSSNTTTATATASPPKQSPPVTSTPPAPTQPVVVSTAPGGELSREDLVAMFKDIVAGMDSLIFQLARREHDLRKQPVDKKEILEMLSLDYQKSMHQIQVNAFKKYNTTEEMAEAAVKKYENDPEFKQVRDRMDLINNALMGGIEPPNEEQLAKQPEWLTVTMVIEIFTVMMESMTQAMRESVDEVKLNHPEGPPPSEEVNERYLNKITTVKDSVLLKYELDEKMLDVAMLKYANDPNLATVMIDLQTNQEKQFTQLRKEMLTGQTGQPGS